MSFCSLFQSADHTVWLNWFRLTILSIRSLSHVGPSCIGLAALGLVFSDGSIDLLALADVCLLQFIWQRGSSALYAEWRVLPPAGSVCGSSQQKIDDPDGPHQSGWTLFFAGSHCDGVCVCTSILSRSSSSELVVAASPGALPSPFAIEVIVSMSSAVRSLPPR